jgi:hypothetical protein
MTKVDSETNNASWDTCVVCNMISPEENTELFVLVIGVCKKIPLTAVLTESMSFIELIKSRRQENNHGGINKVLTCTKNEMLNHIKFCVACRDTNLRNIIIRYEAMKLLEYAQNPKDRILALNVLIKTTNEKGMS